MINEKFNYKLFCKEPKKVQKLNCLTFFAMDKNKDFELSEFFDKY